MKRFISLALALVMVMSLAACGAQVSDADKLKAAAIQDHLKRHPQQTADSISLYYIDRALFVAPNEKGVEGTTLYVYFEYEPPLKSGWYCLNDMNISGANKEVFTIVLAALAGNRLNDPAELTRLSKIKDVDISQIGYVELDV